MFTYILFVFHILRVWTPDGLEGRPASIVSSELYKNLNLDVKWSLSIMYKSEPKDKIERRLG